MKKNKYNNVRVNLDGYKFDSKKEARRYSELKLLEKNGYIKHLIVHPHYILWAFNSETDEPDACGKYEADFSYFDNDLMCVVVEDVKGFKTDMYKFKKKMMKINYGINIKEI